jgi:nucleoid-associated protein YgaU
MRTMAAWMLGAGLAIAILGCEDKNKAMPVVQAAPAQTATPAPYPGDAGAHHGASAMPGTMTPPSSDNMMSDGASPAPTITPEPDPEPVDTAAPPPRTAHKPRKANGNGNRAARQPGPKESYPRKEKASRSYTVKKGDTLQEISQKYYGTTTNWRRIYKANEKKIGTNPDKLTEGMKLNIP